MIVHDNMGFENLPGGNTYIQGIEDLSDLQELGGLEGLEEIGGLDAIRGKSLEELEYMADMGYLGKSFFKRLKKILTAPLRMIAKVDPLAKFMSKHDPLARKLLGTGKKKSSAPPPVPAAVAQTVPVPGNAMTSPSPGAWLVQGTDGTGAAQTYYFPDQASATAYQQALVSSGGQAQVSQVPAINALNTPSIPGAFPGSTSSAYTPLGPDTSSGGGGGGGGAPSSADDGSDQLGPAADTGTDNTPSGGGGGGGGKNAPGANVTAAPVTLAPSSVEGGTNWTLWAAGGLIVGVGVYIYLKKSHPEYLPEFLR